MFTVQMMYKIVIFVLDIYYNDCFCFAWYNMLTTNLFNDQTSISWTMFKLFAFMLDTK